MENETIIKPIKDTSIFYSLDDDLEVFRGQKIYETESKVFLRNKQGENKLCYKSKLFDNLDTLNAEYIKQLDFIVDNLSLSDDNLNDSKKNYIARKEKINVRLEKIENSILEVSNFDRINDKHRIYTITYNYKYVCSQFETHIYESVINCKNQKYYLVKNKSSNDMFIIEGKDVYTSFKAYKINLFKKLFQSQRKIYSELYCINDCLKDLDIEIKKNEIFRTNVMNEKENFIKFI